MHTSGRCDLLSTAETAQMVGRDIATVNRWAKSGRLVPAMRGPRTSNKFYPSDVYRLRDELAAELREQLARVAAATYSRA